MYLGALGVLRIRFNVIFCIYERISKYILVFVKEFPFVVLFYSENMFLLFYFKLRAGMVFFEQRRKNSICHFEEIDSGLKSISCWHRGS